MEFGLYLCANCFKTALGERAMVVRISLVTVMCLL